MEVIAINKLKALVEKIEKIDEDKRELAEFMKAAWEEVRSEGFDATVLKKVLALRKLKKHEISLQDELIDLYRSALEI